MKILKYLMIVAAPVLLGACSSQDEPNMGETAEVSFSTQLPERIVTRGINGTNVTQVACAVYHNGEKKLGEIVTPEADGSVNYKPRLIIGQQYDVVFYAYTDGAYDVTDLSNVTRVAGSEEAKYEAFTSVIKNYEVEKNAAPQTVLLERPMAKLTIATTDVDLTAAEALGEIPASVSLTITGVNTAYNAVAHEAAGETDSYTVTVPVSGSSVTVEDAKFKSLAECYLFPAGGNVTVKADVLDADGKAICSRTIDNVPLTANMRTNIAGDIMTGTVDFSISISGEYVDSDNNTSVQ